MITPAERARVDQFRASLRSSLEAPCGCGECITDEELRTLLALSDTGLLRVMAL